MTKLNLARSEEKIICPWRGAEMKPKGLVMYETRNDEHPRYVGECWCSGKECEASGPCVQGKDKKGFATREEAMDAAKAAAMRRYTPPITAETKLVCPINGAPCSECKPGSPCGVEVINDA